MVVTQTHRRREKIRWVGPVAWARFLEGDVEALRASLCWSEKEPLVFPPSVREMGSDPQGPPLPSPAWQLNSHGRSAELREIPADVRAAMNEQVCPLLLLPPLSLSPPFCFPPLLSQLSDSFQIGIHRSLRKVNSKFTARYLNKTQIIKSILFCSRRKKVKSSDS